MSNPTNPFNKHISVHWFLCKFDITLRFTSDTVSWSFFKRSEIDSLVTPCEMTIVILSNYEDNLLKDKPVNFCYKSILILDYEGSQGVL